MILQQSTRIGRYLDDTPRPYKVWCIYQSEHAKNALIEFDENVNLGMAEAVFGLLSLCYNRGTTVEELTSALNFYRSSVSTDKTFSKAFTTLPNKLEIEEI